MLGPLLVAAPVAPAQAAAWPATKPVGVTVHSVTRTSFGVSLQPTKNADSYRLWVSPKKDDVYVAKLRSRSTTRRAYVSKTPSFAVRDLPYRASPYYVRVATAKGSNYRVGGTYEVWPRPAVPTLTVTADDCGVRLTWPDLNVTGYEIRRAADPGFSQDLKVYTQRGRTTQFTPYGLRAGRPYSFSVRSVNGTSRSAWSAVRTGTPASTEVGLRVVAYNLLGTWADGKRGDFGAGEVVTPWMSSRRAAAAATVRPASPDVVLVQEGSEWIDGWGSDWQVDTFAAALGSQYTVARTQGRAGDADYARRGVHVVYDSTVLAAVGNGGNWALPNGRYAAYQLLQHRSTAARVLAVSLHNTSTSGAAADADRREEFEALTGRLRTYRDAHGGVPVVLGGDVGSYRARWHPDDAPGEVLRGAGYVDALEAAQTRTNTKYGSYNRFRRTPSTGTGSADRVFASPGIGVKAYTQLLRLTSSGSFAGPIPSDHNPVVADVVVPHPAT